MGRLVDERTGCAGSEQVSTGKWLRSVESHRGATASKLRVYDSTAPNRCLAAPCQVRSELLAKHCSGECANHASHLASRGAKTIVCGGGVLCLRVACWLMIEEKYAFRNQRTELVTRSISRRAYTLQHGSPGTCWATMSRAVRLVRSSVVHATCAQRCATAPQVGQPGALHMCCGRSPALNTQRPADRRLLPASSRVAAPASRVLWTRCSSTARNPTPSAAESTPGGSSPDGSGASSAGSARSRNSRTRQSSKLKRAAWAGVAITGLVAAKVAHAVAPLYVLCSARPSCHA